MPPAAEAERALAETTEIEAAAASNVETALDAATRVALEQCAAWREQVERARGRADVALAKTLVKAEEFECRRGELIATAGWLAEVERGGELFLRGGAGGTVKASRGPRPYVGRTDLRDSRSDGRLTAPDALAALSRYVEDSSAEAQRARAAEQAERERLAEERQAQVREMRAGGVTF